MERKIGTVSRGVRCPIIREGDDLAAIVSQSVLSAAEAEGFELRDRDVIAVTESIVATAQGKRYNKNIGPRSSTGRETHDATAGRRFWRRVSPGGRE